MSKTYVFDMGPYNIAATAGVDVFEGLRAPDIDGHAMHFFDDPKRTERLAVTLVEKKIRFQMKTVGL